MIRRGGVASAPMDTTVVEDTRVLGLGLAQQRLPACPEITLWLLQGDVDLNARCDELLNATSLPFWAFCWGGGQALARHVLDCPSEVRGRRVVDFGAGSGVAAIAAALAGAASVVAVDSDPRAREMTLANARLNGVPVEVAARVPQDWDVMLAADVLYETGNHCWLEGLAGRGRVVLVSDPGREGTPLPACPPFATLEARTVPDVDYPRRFAHLYRLTEPGSGSPAESPRCPA
jgi:predicted nicotinamide N-methyase